jgi:hypothetical protein
MPMIERVVVCCEHNAEMASNILGQELFGAVSGVVGLVLVLDFRGFTGWYVRLIFRLMRPVERVLRHVPPWRQILRIPIEIQIRWQIRFFRAIGGLFAIAGLGAVIAGLT